MYAWTEEGEEGEEGEEEDTTDSVEEKERRIYITTSTKLSISRRYEVSTTRRRTALTR
jgi:hypothetical protein